MVLFTRVNFSHQIKPPQPSVRKAYSENRARDPKSVSSGSRRNGFPDAGRAIPFKARCWSGGGRWPGTVWPVRIKSLMWSLRENKKSSSPSHPDDVYSHEAKGRSPNPAAHTDRPKCPACPSYGAVATRFCIFCLRNREKTSSIISLINFQKVNPVAEEVKKTKYGSNG